MRFSKDYSKLDKPIFTTIRKNTRAYSKLDTIKKITTPTKQFRAKILTRRRLKKDLITENLARTDADCSRIELIDMLENWYGKDFDDFVLLTFKKQ